MAQQDNKDWEKQWEGAFSNASETPSPLVWKSIEASLANGGAPNKAWWLWVAAAFLGGVVTTASMFFILRDNEKAELAQNLTKQESTSVLEAPRNEPFASVEDKNIAQTREIVSRPPAKSYKIYKRKVDTASEDLDQNGLAVNGLQEQEFQLTGVQNEEFVLTSLSPIKPNYGIEEAIASVEIRGVYIYDASKFKPKSDVDNSKWLAGLAFSAGAFNQTNQSLPASSVMVNPSGTGFDTRNKGFVDYESIGQSTVMAMSVGRRISSRWVVSGGLGYQVTTNQSSSNWMLVSTSNKDVKNVIGEPQLVSSEQGIAAVKNEFQLEVSPETYQMKNSYQFVSVPLNVGYFLIDKKWKLNLNGGINTDIFYQYSSKDESGDLNEYVVKPSDDENWKYLNLSLGGGLEVSKVFADNYMVTLAPGYRHSLSEFGVAGSSQLQPHVFNVSLKLNYIF